MNLTRLLTIVALAMLDLLWFEFVRHLYHASGRPWFLEADTFVASGRMGLWLLALLFDRKQR